LRFRSRWHWCPKTEARPAAIPLGGKTLRAVALRWRRRQAASAGRGGGAL